MKTRGMKGFGRIGKDILNTDRKKLGQAQLSGAFVEWLKPDTGGDSPRGSLNEMAQASAKKITDPHNVPGKPVHWYSRPEVTTPSNRPPALAI